MAQSPQGFSFQSVVRDGSGDLVISSGVGIRISILDAIGPDNAVYVETHSPTTNANGLVSLTVGSGTPVSGTFATIDWGSSSHYIKTEADPDGGTNYTITGTQQLMSVPYALYAASSGAADAWGLSGNSATVDGTDFIGTTDDIPFNIRVNNQRAGRIGKIIGDGSTFLGYLAGANDDLSENQNTFIGCQAGTFNTAGVRNSAIGYAALNLNTTGYGNTANGFAALQSNTTGHSNTANGISALWDNTTGLSNTANGARALATNTTGSFNSAYGFLALDQNTTGEYNTASGIHALYFNTTGNYNTASGSYALLANITGNYNTALGTSVNVDAADRSNTVVIGGYGNILTTDNDQVRIGNASMTSIGGQVAWSNLSDERVKTNVQHNVAGLEFIMKLNPVTYNYSVARSEQLQGNVTETWDSKYDIEQIRFSGFLAQQVEQAAKDAGYEFSGVDRPRNGNGLWALRYSEFTVPIVKAMQEQQGIIQSQQEQIDALNRDNAAMRADLDRLSSALAGMLVIRHQ